MLVVSKSENDIAFSYIGACSSNSKMLIFYFVASSRVTYMIVYNSNRKIYSGEPNRIIDISRDVAVNSVRK